MKAAVWLSAVSLVAQAAAPQPGPPAARSGLPPLTPDAQILLDQWKQTQASVIEQLRFLQQTYRDDGRAEDAAAIAAQIRQLQIRVAPPSGGATADLVLEGLQNRDAPIVMSQFRGRSGQTLSFAIRGRDDQPVWGTKIYTDDSALETAAVHAGLLRAGQLGLVKVKVLPGQDRYEAAAENGVQSGAAAQNKGSFQFVAVAIAAPPRSSSLSTYRDLVGQSITIPIIGAATGGAIWGTDVYTDDSSTAVAAVHAGAVMPGEFGFVKITLMPGQGRYDGSSRYGVTSQSFGATEGSYRVERASESTVQLPGGEDASRLVPMSTLRSRPGTSFVVQVAGSAGGGLWGTDAYTDDSSVGAAAVHAGLLKPGEIGLIRVTIDRGREAYQGSERNGIKSQSYGKFDGTYHIERVRQ